jgi:hypothetical protein
MIEFKRRKFTYAWLAKKDAYLTDPLLQEYLRRECPPPVTKCKFDSLTKGQTRLPVKGKSYE